MRRKLPVYVLKEVVPWYLGGLALFFTLQMTNVVAYTVGRLLPFRPTLLEALPVYLYRMPEILNQCLVVAVPFAVLLAFGRLAKDSEFKSAMASGVRPLLLLLPMVLPALLIGVVAYFIAGWAAPVGQARYWDYFFTGIFKQQQPQPSTSKYTYAQGNTFYSAGRVQNDRAGKQAQLIGVLVIRGDTIYNSQSGIWDTVAHTWTLMGGTLVGPDGVPRPISGRLTLPQNDVLKRPDIPINQTSTPLLRARLASIQASSPLPSEASRTVAFELSRRLADPFTPLVFLLAAGALGLLVSNRAWASASVILLIFGFYVIWNTVPSLAQAGALSPALAAWLPNLVFLLLAGVLAWRVR